MIASPSFVITKALLVSESTNAITPVLISPEVEISDAEGAEIPPVTGEPAEGLDVG